jgi:CheY-like chemotaxis protein
MDGKALRVLVVEDNPIIRKIASINLVRYGLSVDTANDGREALEMLRNQRYALIFMDVAMPEMDGLMATEQIRRSECMVTRTTPIVGITASASRVECMKAGMDDYVTKPPDYLRILQRWLPQLFPASETG